MPPQQCGSVQQCAARGQHGEVCLLYVCFPLMEFIKELRVQTAADGVCLATVLALPYSVSISSPSYLIRCPIHAALLQGAWVNVCAVREKADGSGENTDSHKQQIVVIKAESYEVSINFRYPFITCICTLCLYFYTPEKVTRVIYLGICAGQCVGWWSQGSQSISEFSWGKQVLEAGSLGWVMT